MSSRIAAVLILAFAAIPARGQQQQPVNQNNPSWVVSVIHTIDLAKAVDRYREQQQVRIGVPGSAPPFIYNIATGLVVDGEGHVVTRLANLDPRDKNQRISVTTNEGVSLPARLIGVDCATGFAVLEVTSLKSAPPSFTSSVVPNGTPVKILSTDVTMKPASVVKSDQVYISPSITVQQGEVRTDSLYSKARGALTLLSPALLSRYDGSVVITADNQIVGLAQYAGFGRAYLFPIEFIRNTVTKRVLEKKDSVPAGWLGTKGVSVAQIADSDMSALGLERRSGVLVREVVPESPAAVAGLLPRDVIVGMDDMDVFGASDLGALLASSPAGRKVKLRAIRNRQPVEVNVVLGARALGEPLISMDMMAQQWEPSLAQPAQMQKRLEELQAQYKAFARSAPSKQRIEAMRELEFEIRQLGDNLRALQEQQRHPVYEPSNENTEQPTVVSATQAATFAAGFVAIGMTSQLATSFQVKDGLLVVKVLAGSAAERAGLRAGDVIVGAEEQEPITAARLQMRLSAERANVALKVVRKGQPVALTISRQ
jgi:serine protease DegQ